MGVFPIKTNYKLKHRQNLTIIPISDLHAGSPFFNKEFFEYLLYQIRVTSDPKIIYLLGDELDVPVKRQGNSSFQARESPNETLEYLISKLKPFRKDIVGIVNSNHTTKRMLSEFNFNLSEVLGNSLDVPFSTNIHHTLSINGEPFTVFASHGTKTSSQLHLMQGACQRSTDYLDCDLVLMGHAHYLNFWSLPRLTRDGYKRRYYALCGHFLKYKDSYADVMGLKPNPEGFMKINVSKDLRVTGNLYNSDEVVYL